MQGSSDNSFIPKRGSGKRKSVGGARQVYVLTYISYILMFATLLSAGGVFLYSEFVKSQRDSQVEALNSEIGAFSQADMERVTQFDLRLRQAYDRLDNSVSIASVFEALQTATIETAQIETLDMTREGDEKFVLKVNMQTDSFDSTLFQRGVFMRNETIQAVEISDVQNQTVSVAGTGGDAAPQPVVSFTAALELSLDDVPANPLPLQSDESTVLPPEIPADAFSVDEDQNQGVDTFGESVDVNQPDQQEVNNDSTI